MLAREPSRTALSAAAHRAAHQLEGARLFTDPLAVKIVGQEAAEKCVIKGDPGMRMFVAARSRFAEDMLTQSLARGVTQLVVLGAGLDTYAYRGDQRGKLAVFEIDHPATQAWKRERLAAIGVMPDANVRYAPVDFENESIADGLARAGFDRTQRTFFFWLGVAPYLSRAAINTTWALIAGNAGGGEVVFDYSVGRDTVPAAYRESYDALTERVASLGEPFLTSFDPATLPDELRAAGFAIINNVTLGDLLVRYFPEAGARWSMARGNIMHAMTK